MPRPWKCPACGHVNESRNVKRCRGCGGDTKRRRPLRQTDAALRETEYGDFAVLSVLIHGGEPHACGCCGKPRGETRRHDRDHDHRTGNPRGLACGGNSGCNMLMLPWVTAKVAAVVSLEYHDRGDMKESARWFRVANYLRRAEDFHAKRERAGSAS